MALVTLTYLSIYPIYFSKIKQALFEENQRFMALHGHVWDPKKDGEIVYAVSM